MRFLPVLAPLVVFAVLCLFAISRVLRFLMRFRATVSDSPLGKGMHLETPLGTIDIKPQQAGDDPDLASIPKYPGAMPIQETKKYEADFHIAGHGGRYTSESYSTDEEPGMVLDFYLRELPDWRPEGYRLTQDKAGCQRAIAIERSGGRTIIQFTVAHTSQDGGSADSGTPTTFASNSDFGVLR